MWMARKRDVRVGRSLCGAGVVALGIVAWAVCAAPAAVAKKAPRGSSRRTPPSVQTGSAQSISTTGAMLTGTVNPNGLTTSYWFQYGTSSAYGSETPAAAAGAGTAWISVSAAVSGLRPAVSYHFRLVARNASGTRRGTDRTFTTAGFYTNPVYKPAAAPDPFVLDNGGSHDDYYAFTTGERFPVLHSSDLVNWSSVGTAMTARPSWVVQSGDWHPWSPSVLHVDHSCPSVPSTSCYVMYYVGLSAQTSANCVAIATSPSPSGPYIDQGPLSNGTTDSAGRPIGCGDNTGYGMIDPSPFVDPVSERTFLYASEDFACPATSSRCTSANSTLKPTISVIELSADGLHAVGGRTPLFSGAAGTWEAVGVSAPTVEGPTALLHDGTYYVLYSGGSWQGAYGMGYATAGSPVGPFTKSASNPILSGTSSVLSPGGGDTPVAGPHAGVWLVYHGRDASYSNPRTLRIDPFSWKPNSGVGAPEIPIISGPTSTPQPIQP